MRLLRCAGAFACLLPLPGLPGLAGFVAGFPDKLAAQAYTPRQIRFEGGGDSAELLRLTGLQPGKPLSKEQIEAAMSKLADTGAFTDLSYTVGPDALVIKLGGASATPGQVLPIRYVNLVWWQPGELTRLLEQRVPLFHGELPLTGSLTDHVCAALVQLLGEKGVPNAKVEAMPSALAPTARGAGRSVGVGAIAVTVTQPDIVLGTLTLSGAAPATQRQLDAVSAELGMQEFESDVTAQEVRDNVSDTEKNAGFLDATVDAPVFSAPRKDLNEYAIDVSAAVHPGELYRITAVDLGVKPPLTAADAEKAADLKSGQPAGAMAIKTSSAALQRAYSSRGYLDSKVALQMTLDHAAHTVALRFTADPGGLYRLAGVDASALPASLQAAFAREFQGKPGVDAGSALGMEVSKALAAMNATHSIRAGMRSNRAQHTVTLVLLPAPTATPAATPPVTRP